MTGLEFLIKFLTLISFDIFIAFLSWIMYKYIDLKYFSTLEITTLIEENKFLKQENQKLNGTSTKFWNKEDKI